ncbi:hypothetical protein ACFY4K_35145 [Streptomyces leeuwenhoekii]|uniref:hypothetical protein n=1 Tax=Streptomyces leeuwenhoekii TaxID=1437453 RepID=UPI003676CC05
MDRELYLRPRTRIDAGRRRSLTVAFAAKGELRRAMISRALAPPLPIAWVTGDCVYGQERDMCRALEQASLGHVLVVPKYQQLHPPFGRIDQAITDAPNEAWEERHSCGGAKGPAPLRLVRRALPATGVFDGDWPTPAVVLGRRSLTRPDEIAYYPAYAPKAPA